MPIVITNNSNTIEFSIANNYSYTVTKGSFDVELHSTDGIIYLVYVIFKNLKGVNREPHITIDWREVTDPVVTSAEDLLDTLLEWNVPRVIVSNGLYIANYDYMEINYSGETTNVYTFKTGGASGTTVATLTLTYSDAEKTTLVSLLKE